MPRNPTERLAEASLSAATPSQPGASRQQEVLCEGWLLKKGRKKLQGYARRYFVLRTSGLLSYSLEPGMETRDQVSLLTAAISTTPGGKDIHVDSGRVTFHIKCLTREDFDRWMSALR